MRIRTAAFGLTLLTTGASLCATASTAHAQSYTLQDLINAHHNLEVQAQRCQFAMNQHLQQMQYAAMRGMMMPMQQPMCMNNQLRVIAQMAYLETAIARANGDTRPACETNNTCNMPTYQPQPGSRRAPPDNSEMDRVIQGYEITPNGNERMVGPNGSHHFDCGQNARDVTGPSYMHPAPNCVER